MTRSFTTALAGLVCLAATSAIATIVPPISDNLLDRWQNADEIITASFNARVAEEFHATPLPHEWSDNKRAAVACVLHRLEWRTGSQQQAARMVANLENVARVAGRYQKSVSIIDKKINALTRKSGLGLAEYAVLAEQCNLV